MGKRGKGSHGSLPALPALAPAALDFWEPGRLLCGGRGAFAYREALLPDETLRFLQGDAVFELTRASMKDIYYKPQTDAAAGSGEAAKLECITHVSSQFAKKG